MIIFLFEKIDLEIMSFNNTHSQVYINKSNNIMPIQLRNKKCAIKPLIRQTKNNTKIVPDESSDSDDCSSDSDDGSCESSDCSSEPDTSSTLSDSDDDDSDYVER